MDRLDREYHEAANAERSAAGDTNALASLAGFMALGVLGPPVVKGMARAGIKALGRASAGQAGRAAAVERALVAGTRSEAGRVAEIARGAGTFSEKARRAAVVEHRMTQAGGGGVNLTRFAENTGVSWVGEAQKGAREWEGFKARTKGIDRIKELRGPQGGELLRQAASAWKLQAAVEIPMFYAADSALGITSGPADSPAWYNPIGQANQFIRWLPTYAAFDVAGRAAMGVPGIATHAVKRGTQGAAATRTGLHAAVSKTTRATDAGFSVVQGALRNARSAYNSRIKNAASPVRTGAHLIVRGAQKAARTAGGGKKGPGFRDTMRRRATEQALMVDRALADARGLFADRGRDLAKGLRDVESGHETLFKNVFVRDAPAPGVMGHLTGAREASVADIRKTYGDTLTDAAKRQLQDLEDDLKGFKAEVSRHGTDAMKAYAKTMDAGQIRVSGFIKDNKGRVRRAPAKGETMYRAGQAFRRATSLGGKFSIAELFQTHTITMPRPSVRQVHRDRVAGGQMTRIGPRPRHQMGQGAAPYTTGFDVANTPGGMTSTLYGVRDGHLEIIAENQLMLMGGGKLQKVVARMAGVRDPAKPPVRERWGKETADGPSPLRRIHNILADKYDVASGTSDSLFSRVRNALGSHSPRRLFSQKSGLWDLDEKTDMGQDGVLIAHAVHVARTALTRAAPTFGREELLDYAVKRVYGAEAATRQGISGKSVATNDRTALDVAAFMLRTSGGSAHQAPSQSRVRALIRDAEATHHDELYATGHVDAMAEIRRFIFEQGTIGTGDSLQHARTGIHEAGELLGDLARRGKISEAAALEAKTGLVGLEIAVARPQLAKDPYTKLAEGGKLAPTGSYGDAHRLLAENRETLEAFGASRHRFDTGYSQDPYSKADAFDTTGDAYVSINADVSTVLKTARNYGFDTSRDALGFLGLGWDASRPYMGSVRTSAGETVQASVARLWGRRAVATAALYGAYTAADTTADVVLPDGAPFAEGIGVATKTLLAKSRIAQAEVFDATGVTGAAQYMEGLLPKSTSILPGAAAGAFLAGPWGALGGAVLNRIANVTLRDTMMEGIPLLSFTQDITKDAERVRDEMEGREWVGVRRGRGFLLSTGDFEGGRIEQYRPNWYTQAKSQYKATPALYGSKLEQAVFRDLPLIDFSLGDLIDPDYIEQKQYADRPYMVADRPFSDVPLVGPLLGRTLGEAYLALHPNASTRPLHMEAVVGQYAGESGPGRVNLSGGYGAPAATGMLLGSGMHGQTLYGEQGNVAVAASSARATFDEQFYRTTEAMGFTGFLTQQAVGGEGLFRDAILPSASEMDSTGRAFHDMALGDLLGVGEAVRRLYPFQRNRQAYGIRNTQADWMPDELKVGDPYCLLPDTLMVVDGRLERAEDAHRLVSEGDHTTITHRGHVKPLLATAVRDVDEEVVVIRTALFPWPLAVTKAHPVLVLRGKETTWALAGDVRVGDTLIAPVGPTSRGIIVTQSTSPRARARWVLETDGVVLQALAALWGIEPTTSDKYQTDVLTDDERFRVDRAFNSGACKYERKNSATVANLCRIMADHGLPPDLPGVQSGPLRALMMTIEDRIPELGPRPGWRNHTPYEHGRTPEQQRRDAAYVLWRALAAAQIGAAVDEDYQFHPGVKVRRPRTPGVGRRRTRAAYAEVVSVETLPYTGPVYAFEVADEESFVAAGVATHNSKVMMGEAVLPGEGFEAVGGRLVDSPAVYDMDDYAGDAYDTALHTLDVAGRRTSWAKEQATQMLVDSGIAVQAEAVFVDEQRRLTAVAAQDAGGAPILIESVDSARFGRGISSHDRARAVLAAGAAGKRAATVAYVNEDTGELQMHEQEFDDRAYDQAMAVLQAGRTLADSYDAQGYGAHGALYTPVERLRVLVNAEPFGDSWKREERKARALYEGSALTPEETKAYETVVAQREAMAMPFEIYPDRFGIDELFSPKAYSPNLTHNQHIKAAAEYSLPERVAGALYGGVMSTRNPLTSKFFGHFSLEDQYEAQVLLDRGFQDWSKPIEDFVVPYMEGLAIADDPMQGASSWAVGGFLVGGGMYAATMGVAGAVYGAAHGLWRDEKWIPPGEQKAREFSQQWDRVQYARSAALYQATGQRQYADAMERTAYGYVSGLREDGLAGAGRPGNTQAGGNMGFGSPWQGQDPARDIAFDPRQAVGTTPVPLPPAAMGAFPAAPTAERALLRAALAEAYPERQEHILSYVSDDMASVLSAAWGETYGTAPDTRMMTPPPSVSFMGAFMAPGADQTAYQIRSAEEYGIATDESGAGWRASLVRLKGAFTDTSAAEAMTGSPRTGASGAELQQAIQKAAAAMGILAVVEVSASTGGNEIDIEQVQGV